MSDNDLPIDGTGNEAPASVREITPRELARIRPLPVIIVFGRRRSSWGATSMEPGKSVELPWNEEYERSRRIRPLRSLSTAR